MPTTLAVYINDQNPAVCNGTVYGWRFCSYPTSGNEDPPFQVQISMYRRRNDDESYHLVNGSSNELTIDERVVSYTYEDRFLEPSRHFSVEEGDMVAACWTGTNRVELSSRGGTLLASNGQCSQSVIDRTSVVTVRAALYLSALVSKLRMYIYYVGQFIEHCGMQILMNVHWVSTHVMRVLHALMLLGVKTVITAPARMDILVMDSPHASVSFTKKKIHLT